MKQAQYLETGKVRSHLQNIIEEDEDEILEIIPEEETPAPDSSVGFKNDYLE